MIYQPQPNSSALVRTENQKPSEYRLMTNGKGYWLQGRFDWRQGDEFGHEWRNLPNFLVGDSYE